MAQQQQMQTMNGQPVPLTIDQFLRNTQDATQSVGSYNYVDNNTITAALPKAGMATNILVLVSVQVVVAGTVTSGKWASYPQAPWSILKRITLASNTAKQIRSLSGNSMYQYLRKRTGVDVNAMPTGTNSSGWNTILGVGASSIVPGANVTTGTYNIVLPFIIPIAYNARLDTGLIIMQMNNVQFNLGLTFGACSSGISATGGSNDLFNALVGTGLSVTVTGSAVIDYQNVPLPPAALPNTSMIMTVSDSINSPLSAGDNITLPPPQQLYTMMGLEYFNNGAIVAPSNFSRMQMIYGGTVARYTNNPPNKQLIDLYQQGLQWQDGMVWYDMGMRTGLEERRDTSGALNAASLTDLRLITSLPTTLAISGYSGVKLITEALESTVQGQ